MLHCRSDAQRIQRKVLRKVQVDDNRALEKAAQALRDVTAPLKKKQLEQLTGTIFCEKTGSSEEPLRLRVTSMNDMSWPPRVRDSDEHLQLEPRSDLPRKKAPPFAFQRLTATLCNQSKCRAVSRFKNRSKY
mmetsp:Transcript_17862/g.30804  ORF Transcript_17862/g.30804 Transcript_17862/m.30804 type:complete len:132 (-) Transcript_17862:83-478(-)